MPIRLSLLAITTTLVACNNDSHSTPGAVTITTDDSTYLYLAFRDGTGPWTQLDPKATSITVHDDYQLIAACGDSTNGFETIIQGATVDDGSAIELPCFAFGTLPTIVTASGTMVQAGTVAIELAQSSTAPNWSFDFEVSTGAHSLLAIGDGKAIVQRGLDLESDQTLPSIDTSSGTALTTSTFTLDHAATNATTTSRMVASIGPDFMFMDSSPGTSIQPLPASLLQSGDFQHLEFTASTDTGSQFASVDPAKTSSTSIELLPPLTGVTFSNGQAAWTTTLPAGNIELDAFQFDTTVPSFTHIQGTAAWLGAQTSLAIDTHDIVGFQPEWLADTSTANLSMSVSTTVANVFVSTVAQPLATSVARDARSFRARRRSQDRLRGR